MQINNKYDFVICFIRRVFDLITGPPPIKVKFKQMLREGTAFKFNNPDHHWVGPTLRKRGDPFRSQGLNGIYSIVLRVTTLIMLGPTFIDENQQKDNTRTHIY